MTDDYAIEGDDGGYVPCLELPAELDAEEEGAIYGLAGGFVPRDQQAATSPAPERGAIVGSAVGFVPKPCEEEEECYQELVIDHFDRIRGAGTGLGTATIGTDWTIVVNPPPAGNYASVDGDKGIFPFPGPSTPEAAPADWTLNLPINALDAKPWIEFRWLCEGDVTGGAGRHALTDSGSGYFIFWRVATSFPNPTAFTFGRVGGFSLLVTKAESGYVNGDPFWVALRFEAGGAGSILYFKAWLAADPEPTDWDEDSSAHSVTLALSAIDQLWLEPGIITVGDEFRVDEILIRYPCEECDVDWVYYVWYEDFVPPGAPDGVINALLGPEDNEAKYTGSITAGPTDSGRTWLFAEAVIDCPQLVLTNGRVDLYYEVEQETDHIIVSDLPSDTVRVWQLGHLWLGFGSDPPDPPDPPDVGGHYVQFYFRDNVVSGPNLYWRMEVESFGGALYVSDTWSFLQPEPFEAGTRYSVRVRVERGAVDNFDLKAKLWKTAEAEPVDWMFTPANVDVSNTPLRQLSYAVMNVAQPLHQLQSHDVGERHLMALQVNDITLSPQP